MNAFHSDYPPAQLDLLARSIELWRDPFDSPEVPDEQTLRAFLVGEEISPEIHSQIVKSIDCQRALALLKKRTETSERADVTTKMVATLLKVASEYSVAKQRLSQSVSSSKRGTTAAETILPSPGSLFSTKSRVEFWDGQKCCYRHTFRPLDILILDEGHKVPWGDTIFRCVACSPVEHWPEALRADDESLIRVEPLGEFVAHWWLNYPISLSQLERKVREIEGADGPEVIVPERFAPAGPEPNEEDDELWLERDQLHACAAYLGANAHARRMAAEEAQSKSRPVALDTVILWRVLQPFLMRIPRAAAGDDIFSKLAVINEEQLKTTTADVSDKELESRGEGYARVVIDPTQDRANPNNGYMQWEIHPATRAKRALILDPILKCELGSAEMTTDGEAVTLKDVPWSVLEPFSMNPEKLKDLVVVVIADE